ACSTSSANHVPNLATLSRKQPSGPLIVEVRPTLRSPFWAKALTPGPRTRLRRGCTIEFTSEWAGWAAWEEGVVDARGSDEAATRSRSGTRLSELMGVTSLPSDLALGHPTEHVLR